VLGDPPFRLVAQRAFGVQPDLHELDPEPAQQLGNARVVVRDRRKRRQAVRASAFVLIYAIPVAISGSTTQLFVARLLRTTGNPMALSYYMTVVALVGLAAILPLPESAPFKWLLLDPEAVLQA
jgi:hypothetical protein